VSVIKVKDYTGGDKSFSMCGDYEGRGCNIAGSLTTFSLCSMCFYRGGVMGRNAVNQEADLHMSNEDSTPDERGDDDYGR